MKKRLLFSLLYTAFPLFAVCQSWVRSDAIWHHHYAEGNTGVVGYVRTSWTGDTILNGTTAKRLTGVLYGYSAQTQEYFTEEVSELLTTGSDDLAVSWTGNEFDTLFHFAAVPGDSWQPPGALSGDPVLTVQDTGHLIVDGISARFLVIDLGPQSSRPSPDTLVERMGFFGGYLDVWSSYILDGGFRQLRCYSDIDLVYTADDIPCDMILGQAELRSLSPLTSIYPNPGQDRLWFADSFRHGPLHLSVLDIRGIMVREELVADPTLGIDVSGLVSGCYAVHCTEQDGRSFVTKWVKQDP